MADSVESHDGGQSTIDDDSNQIPLSESGKIIQNHHKKTGCHGEVKEYEGRDGAFCRYCKEEWIKQDYNPDVNIVPPEGCSFKPVAHHYVPTFCCLQVSDTGYFVRWNDLDKLKRGDHVAWLRFPSYWHHAIVSQTVEEHKRKLKDIPKDSPDIKGSKKKKEHDETISVIEWTLTGIKERERKETDFVGNCLYSPMYKVDYPKEIEDQNPPELVLLRANARKGKDRYHPLLDNCEHFATFCKTGSHKCNQLFQYKLNMRTWFARFFVALLRIALAVSFSESIELILASKVGKDWVGATLLIAFECLCFLLAVWITYKYDTKKESFEKDENPQFSKAFRRAITKNAFQSLIMVLFVCVFSVYIGRAICGSEEEGQPPGPCSKRVGIEIGLGILGGIVGNMLGFFLFYFIPYPCCCENKELDDVENQIQQATASNTESREKDNVDNDNESDTQQDTNEAKPHTENPNKVNTKNNQQLTHSQAQSSIEGDGNVVHHPRQTTERQEDIEGTIQHLETSKELGNEKSHDQQVAKIQSSPEEN